MATQPHDIREACLLAAAGLRRLPNFRGKVRALLALHRLLGLGQRHFPLSTILHHPIPFRVVLDLFCKHERMAFFMDRYEADTVEFLFRLWQPGTPFLDVGANIGLISLPFVRLAQAAGHHPATGPVACCIEAAEANRNRLAANVELNRLGAQIEVVAAAVGEREKDVDFFVEGNQKSGEGTGTANILAENSTYKCERISLHVTTIDQLIAAGRIPRHCGLVKIDTDGYDLFALMGAKKFLAEARPLIFGEFHAHCLNWHRQTLRDVQDFLAPLGYEVYTRREGWSFRAPAPGDPPFVQDALCVPREKTDQVRGCLS